jgi:4-hydroxyphenylpyruvate dioxygenase-like putative hemolysin
MKLRVLAVLLAFTIAAPVGAQQTAAQVTDAQVGTYKAAAQQACKDAGTKQGDPAAKVEAFCGCLLETLNKNMTASEWRQAYFFSQKKQVEEESKIVSPHLAKLAVCRAEP